MSLRRQRPTWGAKKLLVRLHQEDPRRRWPAASTVGDLLKREGLTEPHVRRRPGERRTPELMEASAPNVSWSAVFKGWFRTGDGVGCEPLTVMDGYSRYIRGCEMLPQVRFAPVQHARTRLFREHGLPLALRTDNGNPFPGGTGLAACRSCRCGC